MDLDKIDSFRAWLCKLRGRLGNIKHTEIVTFAEALGRRQRPGSSPPMYVSNLPGRRSLPIHFHPKAMKRGTAKGALDILEGDIDALEFTIADRRGR